MRYALSVAPADILYPQEHLFLMYITKIYRFKGLLTFGTVYVFLSVFSLFSIKRRGVSIKSLKDFDKVIIIVNSHGFGYLVGGFIG